MIRYSVFDWLFYLFLYAFLAWVIEVCLFSVKGRRFVNRGFIALPFLLPYGITMALLIQVLPTLERNMVLQGIVTWVVFTVVSSLAAMFTRLVSRMEGWQAQGTVPESTMRWVSTLCITLVLLVVYYVVHPVLVALVELLPDILVRIAVIAALALLAVDFAVMFFTVRRGEPEPEAVRESRGWVQTLADRIGARVRRRLEKAYPGISQSKETEYTFGKGLSVDKLVWVFLICAFVGDILETLFCRFVGGEWVSRSSVLYGQFSFVWGIGAVLLTVTLRPLTGKSDRWIFLGGFVIGGVFEYMCSVFTELVFGTVFWDYSDMPLNIGGRTNVLYCFFWALLAVVWVKIIYPPMDKAIERIPPVIGKVVTWAVVFVMICDGLLTAAAMIRYNTRAERSEPSGVFEQFLDYAYDDEFMEHRWTNMVSTGAGDAQTSDVPSAQD